jgi:hypothetical protein
MNKRPVGYVYHPYPKMIGDVTQPKGYRIVKTEEEHQAFIKSLEPAPVVEKPKSKKSIKYTIED